jgi:uncharacterized protein
MNKITKINRREFITGSAAAAAAAAVGLAARGSAADSHFHAVPSSPLPTRAFGKTGARLPILTHGCGSRWMMYEDEQALEVIERAIDGGITYLDSAHNYGKSGRSEKLIGTLMPARRKDVLIQTKVSDRDPDVWWSMLETSLKRLNVDYVDTLLIHQLGRDNDLAKLERKGGVLEQLYKAREQKLARWIGFSSHTDGTTAAKFIRRHDIDAVQMAINVATDGPYDFGHEERALPAAVEKGIGIIAMKVMGQDNIANKYDEFDAATCLRYSLSLPVTTATVGMPKPEHLEWNLESVREFKPFAPERMTEIKGKARGKIETSFLDFMRGHDDVA